MLSIVTCTGSRPEALSLLAGYINAQTYTGGIRWIIVDDCDPMSPVPEMRGGVVVEFVRPEWRWAPGMNTQSACMWAALSRLHPNAPVLVMEDDDAYLPGYIDTMLQELETAELVGERDARYYNVATRRCQQIGGSSHASLASTALRGAAMNTLREICAAGSRRIDMDLWRCFAGPKRLLGAANVIGIKGMPGRAGIGVGHRATFGTPDTDGETLIHWLGADRAKPYLEALWR